MIFPFRSSAIFRNRWIALLWAVGICFTASEIVDSLSGVVQPADKGHASDTSPPPDEAVPVRPSPIVEPDRVVR